MVQPWKRWPHDRSRASWRGLVALVWVLGGQTPCEHCQPEYSDDRKIVILEYGGALYGYDVFTRTVTKHLLPADWTVSYLERLGNQLWVEGSKLNAEGNISDKHTSMRFDPVRKEFIAGPTELEGRDWLHGAFGASYEGEKCIFVKGVRYWQEVAGKRSYEVYSYPDFKFRKSVLLPRILPAGEFCWISDTSEDTGAIRSVHIDLLDATGKVVVTIPGDDATRNLLLKEEMRITYARYNAKERVLLLIYGVLGIDTLYVCDTNTGRVMWGAKTRNAFYGEPRVGRSEVCRLVAGDGISVVRYQPDEKSGGLGAKEETLLKYSSESPLYVGQYSISPDGSHFVVEVSNPATEKPEENARLLIIPIEGNMQAKDVIEVPLGSDPSGTKTLDTGTKKPEAKPNDTNLGSRETPK